MPRGTLWLTSATNPENGTVSYTYNADGTLAGKTDANGNTETCNYGAQRLISIPDRQQTFAYDTCPAGATGCVSAPGQLMQAAFGSNVGPDELSFAYNYAYTPASKVSSKTMVVMSSWYWGDAGADPSSASLAVNYTYDNQGALTSLQVPLSFPYSPVVFTYTLDAMERPTGDSNRVSGVTYNAANQMLFDGVRTWTYNNLLQATSVSGTGMSMTYNYSANKNNGQITSSVDGITNETITYTYDALKRLVAANGLNWTEKYVYDGFGNLTQMNPTGGAPTLSVSVALDQNNVPNNRISASGVTYDNNGNLTLGFGNIGPVYDAANRVSQVWMNGQPNTYYGYDPDNRRVYSGGTGHGADTIYLYGVDGKKLATYTTSFTGTYPWYTMNLNNQSYNEYFGGRLVSAEGNLVRTDRLDSVRSGGPGGLGYQAQYPYGVEYTTTANDREKYATYTRDSLTGFDYAVNRYYSSQWGRFLSPDPYMANTGGPGDPRDPQSWNRYSYVRGDPISLRDRLGLADEGGDDGLNCLVDGQWYADEFCSEGGGPGRAFSDSDQHGGGGGAITNPLSNNTMRAEWYRALELADKYLSEPDCARLFGLTGAAGNASPDPLTVLSNISNSYSFAPIPSQAGSNGTMIVTSAQTLGIGSQSVPIGQGATMLVSQSVQITVNNVAGSFVTQGPSAWVVTILHELGHAYWDLYGPGTSMITPDGTNVQASQQNTALIESQCKPQTNSGTAYHYYSHF